MFGGSQSLFARRSATEFNLRSWFNFPVLENEFSHPSRMVAPFASGRKCTPLEKEPNCIFPSSSYGCPFCVRPYMPPARERSKVHFPAQAVWLPLLRPAVNTPRQRAESAILDARKLSKGQKMKREPWNVKLRCVALKKAVWWRSRYA